MALAVLGAGIQGCCVALELASAGLKVDLFDKSPEPLYHASRWNEGKLHLGYVYANDRSLRTARAMIEGSLAFSGFFRHYLGSELPADKLSSDFIYGVHRDSLLSVQEIQAHFQVIDEMIEHAIRSSGNRYPGISRPGKTERLNTSDFFNPERVIAAFRTPERSVDTHYIAGQLTEMILANPHINFIGNTYIEAVRKCNSHSFEILLQDGRSAKGYRHVVNTTWEDRLRIDQTMGYQPEYSWVYRYKLAIHIEQPEIMEDIPSSTFLLGPFGDVVNFRNGKYYLSWYPDCCIVFSRDNRPGSIDLNLDREKLEVIAQQSYFRLAELIPTLAKLKINLNELIIRGGYICAIGSRDINFATSELHRRDQSGVFSDDGYHSIFTGKYTTAPLHARTLRSRIITG